MDLRAVVSLLRARSELAAHDQWTREELLARQASGLAELRAFAVARSPFYREFHRGFGDAPLEDLPVLSKATVMEHFDELVTDPAVRLKDVETHLRSTGPTGLFRGRYRVAATGGTTGRRGVFLSDRSEWTPWGSKKTPIRSPGESVVLVDEPAERGPAGGHLGG